MQTHPKESATIIGEVLGVSAEEAVEQMAGAYDILLAEMGRSFAPGEDTHSFHGSSAIIARLLKDNGQIPTIPDFSQTYDARFTEALVQPDPQLHAVALAMVEVEGGLSGGLIDHHELLRQLEGSP